MMDLILFGVFPYVAIALAVAVGFYRYCFDRYSYSSQSSQFLESRALFWGSVPWHYAILLILSAHLLAFLFPSFWGTLLGAPGRLYLLEVSGIALRVFVARNSDSGTAGVVVGYSGIHSRDRFDSAVCAVVVPAAEGGLRR